MPRPKSPPPPSARPGPKPGYRVRRRYLVRHINTGRECRLHAYGLEDAEARAAERWGCSPSQVLGYLAAAVADHEATAHAMAPPPTASPGAESTLADLSLALPYGSE